MKDMETTHSTDTTPPSFPCCMCNGEAAPRQQGMTLPGILRTCLAMLVLATFLAGCGRHGDFRQRLDDADSLMDCQPDSAYRILCSLDSIANGMPRSLRMYHWLLRSKAQNKAFVPFADDSLMSSVAEYYDSHGNANEQMLSHYIMGCIYRDMNLAPKAIEEYHEAVERADTSSVGFNWRTLVMVHSQLASLYSQISLYSYENEELQEALRLSRGKGYMSLARVFGEKMCHILYKERKFEECVDAARLSLQECLAVGDTVGVVMSGLYVFKSGMALGRYEVARHYLDMYASAVAKGMLPYESVIGGELSLPYLQGMYYQGIGDVDSALICLSGIDVKELEPRFRQPVSRILSECFMQRHQVDSASKYMRMFAEACESNYDEELASSCIAAKEWFDYGIERREAETQAKRSERQMLAILWLVAGILLLSLVLLSSLLIYIRTRRKLDNLDRAHCDTLRDVKVKESQISDLTNRNSLLNESLERETKQAVEHMPEISRATDVIQQKCSEIEQQKNKILGLERLLADSHESESERIVKESSVVRKFRKMIYAKHVLLEDAEWDALSDELYENYPAFGNLISQKNLSVGDFRVCLLTKAGFAPSEIDILMQKKHSFASNARKRLHNLVFGFPGSASDFDIKIQALH